MAELLSAATHRACDVHECHSLSRPDHIICSNVLVHAIYGRRVIATTQWLLSTSHRVPEFSLMMWNCDSLSCQFILFRGGVRHAAGCVECLAELRSAPQLLAQFLYIKIHLWRRMEMFHCLLSVILKLFARLFTSSSWLFVASDFFLLHRKSHSIQIDCYIVQRAQHICSNEKTLARAHAYIVQCECARIFLFLYSICVRIFEWRCKFWKRVFLAERLIWSSSCVQFIIRS